MAIGIGCFLSAQILSAQTNLISSTPTDTMPQNALNGYLLIQEQLHATQLAIENNRQEAEAEAKRNADEMSARIQTLEQTISAQRAHDAEANQKIEQLTLILAGAFGLLCLGGVLLIGYLQWRAVTRLVALAVPRSPVVAAGNGHVLPSLAVEESNARLFGAVDKLEKRILELEQFSRAPLAEKNSPEAHQSKNITSVADERETHVVALLAEGQRLLDAHKPEKAMECFDSILSVEPQHAEALLKKAGALEKLDRLDEAIAYYDRAIAADDSLAIAYLQKGGLFNRLARYEEAMECYEKALHSQEKRAATSP
ncbi:MAG TPA: tetratricopeptide repeat protein [Verrucomicrobiae bacterium]|nr:tetratricopeptide repeat protein [Verrucomicrobiae bacterium]